MADPVLSPAELLAVLTVTGHKEIPARYRSAKDFAGILAAMRDGKLDGDATDTLHLRDEIDDIVNVVIAQHAKTTDELSAATERIDALETMIKALLVRVLDTGAAWDIRQSHPFKELQADMGIYK